jgi:hypothetical protein
MSGFVTSAVRCWLANPKRDSVGEQLVVSPAPSVRNWSLCFLSMLLSGCLVMPPQKTGESQGVAFTGRSSDAAMARNLSDRTLTVEALQLEILSYSGRFLTAFAEAVDRSLAEETDPQARVLLRQLKLGLVSSAVAIATERYPLQGLREYLVGFHLQLSSSEVQLQKGKQFAIHKVIDNHASQQLYVWLLVCLWLIALDAVYKLRNKHLLHVGEFVEAFSHRRVDTGFSEKHM